MAADRYQYLIVMGLCLAVTLPLEFLFGARVWRRPRRLVVALLPVLFVFGLWDAWAISRDTWWFAPQYVTGWTGPLRIPFEEIVFFVVIPICGLLTLEAVRNLTDPSRRDRLLIGRTARDTVRDG